jgi:hypothetical protein
MQVSENGMCLPLGLYPSGDLGLFTYYCTKKRKCVRFLRTSPKDPPSPAQIRQRALWTGIAHQWTSLGVQGQEPWRRAAAGARIRITAFNLYIYYHARNDLPCLNTIANQSGVPVDQLV